MARWVPLWRRVLRAPPPWPPGHYYSSVPDLRCVMDNASRIFRLDRELLGIDLQEREQLALFRQLGSYYEEQPFTSEQHVEVRYYFKNDQFGYGDALVLYAMMRHLKPHRIIEVGSGFSSAVMLDTLEVFQDHSALCTFIDPDPTRLNALLRGSDPSRHKVINSTVQSIDPGIFAELRCGDILFIDSSHVSKIGSDVNFLLLEVLPRLASGVYVHFHDVFYPFEYPREWVYQGRAWNEAYLLHAFLLFNEAFEIVLFNSMLHVRHHEMARRFMPLWAEDPAGSLWLRRT